MKRVKPPQDMLQASPSSNSPLVAIIIMKEMPVPIPRAHSRCKGGGAVFFFSLCNTQWKENKSPGLVLWVKSLCGSATCKHGPFAIGVCLMPSIMGLFYVPFFMDLFHVHESPYALRCILGMILRL